MIAYIVLSIILIAFVWLLNETDYLLVRLPVGAVVNKTLSLPAPEPILLLDVPHYHPSVFIVEDMPDTFGNLEILAVRE
jgi:hypothetical protein